MYATEQRLKVFISYTRESELHDSRVATLANRIIAELGFDCDIDQFHQNQNWPKWMEDRIEWADKVIVIATPTYHRRWTNQEEEGVGLGAKWESMLTRQQLYESEGNTDKFVPLVFAKSHLKYIPLPLRGYTRIVLDPAGALDLLRARLLGIPPVERAKLSPIVPTVKVQPQYFPSMALPSGGRQDARGAAAEAFDPAMIGLSSDGEELISNIFPVEYSATIYRALLPKRKGGKAFKEDVEHAWTRAKCEGNPPTDYLQEGTTVYRLLPFTEEPWLSMSQQRKLSVHTNFPARDWAESSKFADTNAFIKLLNGALKRLCATHDMAYSEDLDCHLFVQRGSLTRKVTVKALRSSGTRTLVKAITDRDARTIERILHWQHQAFRHQFKRFDRSWYLVVTPFWAFTSDGKVAKSRFQRSWSSKARLPERNRAVLGHVLLWKAVLTRQDDFWRPFSGLRVLGPETFTVSPSVIDEEWIKITRAEERAVLSSTADED